VLLVIVVRWCVLIGRVVWFRRKKEKKEEAYKDTSSPQAHSLYLSLTPPKTGGKRRFVWVWVFQPSLFIHPHKQHIDGTTHRRHIDAKWGRDAPYVAHNMQCNIER